MFWNKFYFVSHKNLKYKALVLLFCKTHLTGHGQVKLVSLILNCQKKPVVTTNEPPIYHIPLAGRKVKGELCSSVE